MDVNDLVCDTLEEFLMECVGSKIEEVSELPKMLKDIHQLAGYLGERIEKDSYFQEKPQETKYQSNISYK